MNIFQAIILGIVEGITEFLPISSTGHLLLTEKILGVESTDGFFTVVIQFGAILAAIWYFRIRIREIASASWSAFKAKKKYATMNHDERYGIWILVSILPTLVIGFLLRKNVDEWQKSTWIIVFSTIFFGILFYLIEQYSKQITPINKKDISLKNLLIMGIAQAVAVVPGVSRSGSTIVGGLTQRIAIKDAVELSFIMGIPVIFLASIYKIVSNLDGLTIEMISLTLVGVITSFIVGLWSIKLTLGILVKRGFFPFMVYRIALGILLIILIQVGYLN